MLLGMVLAQYRVVSGLSTAARIAALLVFILILAVWPQIAPTGFNLAAKLVLTFCFLAVLSTAGDTPSDRVSGWLRAIGVASMAIYLAHTIFSAALREALLVAGVTDLATHLVLGTLVGILVPLIGFRIARRLGLSRLLGF